MTIADLAAAFRGIPRDAVILLDMPGGLLRLRMVRAARIANRDGAVVLNTAFERFAVILTPHD